MKMQINIDEDFSHILFQIVANCDNTKDVNEAIMKLLKLGLNKSGLLEKINVDKKTGFEFIKRRIDKHMVYLKAIDGLEGVFCLEKENDKYSFCRCSIKDGSKVLIKRKINAGYICYKKHVFFDMSQSGLAEAYKQMGGIE